MRIKQIILQNYQCYYDIKTFEFTDGLNFIIGGNTEGKTKFFEGFEWLLSNEKNSDKRLVSAKKIAEAAIGDRFTVSVTMVVDDFNIEKSIEKYFIVEKTSEQGINISKSEYKAIIDDGKERRPHSTPLGLLEEVFPSKLRKYSLFKGESELSLFENQDALRNLIDSYSNAKYFDQYVDLTQKSSKIYSDELIKETRSVTTNFKKLDKITNSLNQKGQELKRAKSRAKVLSDELENLQKKLEEIESSQERANDIQELNKEIDRNKLEIDKKSFQLKESYNRYLFDDLWIVKKMGSELDIFQKKLVDISVEKRRLDKEFLYSQVKQEAVSDVIKEFLPLPISVPGQALMTEMLDEHLCKFCNREFEHGDQTHDYMQGRLNDYLESLKPQKADEQKTLFVNDNYKELEYINSGLKENFGRSDFQEEIDDRIEYNASRNKELRTLADKVAKLEKEKLDIVSRSNLSESDLTYGFNNYQAWNKQLRLKTVEFDREGREIKKIEGEILELETDLSKITNKAQSENSKFLTNASELLNNISKIFRNTREEKFKEFIFKLESLANEKYAIISETGFAGEIKLYLESGNKAIEGNYSITVDLYSNGAVVDASTSARTSMYLSILLAISELTKETHSVKYPLIMDAPISSFDPNKRRQLWKVLHDIEDTQIILVMYEFINEVGEDNEPVLDRELYDSVSKNNGMFIKIARPFNKADVTTINTEIHKL